MPKQNKEQTELFEFEPIKGFPMLHWKGKRPYTSTQYYPAQIKETHGESTDGWINKIFWGDNLQVMSHLLKQYRGKVNLIYIDPPFDSKADYKRKIELRGKKVNNDYTSFEEKQYTDIWSNDDYLQFMYERLILMRELLSDNGSIYLHCDWHKSQYLRCIIDEIFGSNNFLNEIVWYYRRWNIAGKTFATNHDTLLYYAKNKGKHTFNQLYIPKSAKSSAQGKAWKSVIGEDGVRRSIQTDEPTRGVPMPDVWEISMINPVGNEREGYPTQKPEKLLERLIKSSSNEGDIVFDCFMGSGTTQAVAMKLGRRFIGADINLGAIHITTKRLLNIQNDLQKEQTELFDKKGNKEEDKPTKLYTGFEVYYVNNYDFFHNPAQAKDLLIEALEITPYSNNTVFDGEKDGYNVKIMPINRIATKVDLNSILTGVNYKEYEKKKNENPNQIMDNIMLICMGHEPDLGAELKKQIGYNIKVEVVDILRDKSNLEFKRDSEADIKTTDGELIIESFYPMNLLQKLSLMKENVEDWKELVESIMIDWNYDGVILEPKEIDIPDKKELVKGTYKIPKEAGTIKIKITDVLSEVYEEEIQYG